MKHLKKSVLYILIAALCLSLLAGCGDKSGGESTSGTDSTPAAEETAAHPDYVYTSEFIPVAGSYSNSFDYLCYDESSGRLLASTYGKVGERELAEGEVLSWEGENWIWGVQLYWLGLDGSAEKLEGYVPLEPEGDEATTDVDSSSSLSALMMDGEGNILTLECIYRSWNDDPDDLEPWSEEWWDAGYYELYYHNEQTYYLRVLAEDGSEISCAALSGLAEASPDPDNFYINQVQLGPDGRVYLAGDQMLYVVAQDGTLVKAVQTDNWIDNLLVLSDGVAACYWGDSGEVIALLDPETLEPGEATPVSNIYDAIAAPADSGYDFYYTNGSNLMGCSLATGETGKILNWINCDINNNEINRLCALPDGRLLSTSAQWDSDSYDSCTVQLVVVSKVPYDSVAHKQTLTLATQSLDWDARDAIIDFNRSNDEYRIEVLDYSEYNTEEDYSAGLTKLTTEILAGNVPDILDLAGMPLAQFASKGLLTDLYPLLDADSELSRDDLFPGVLQALETNGCLYRTASSFSVRTVIGAASVVGDTPGWTLADYRAALATMPEGCTPFEDTTTRSDILYNMLYMELDSLIDWETGECRFDSQAFRELLEFAAEFPESFDWDNYEWTGEDDTYDRISTGQQMLVRTDCYSLDEFQMYNALFGGDATYIGYPVSEGTGNALSMSSTGYAITAKCAAPEAAWQFLRQFFTEEYQTENAWGFPTNRAAFDATLKEAMTPEYQTDENGNYVLDENGQKIEQSKGGYGWGNFQTDIYAMTQAEADKIIDLINSTTRVLNYSYDSTGELTEIILSDTEAYFLGQKSLDETVKLLQSKLNIYINEQR